MNLKSLLQKAVDHIRRFSKQIIPVLKSFDLKNRIISLYKWSITALRVIYRHSVKAIKQSRSFAVQFYRKARQHILLTIDYLARKTFLFVQWSNENIRPRWKIVVSRSKTITIQAARFLAISTKTIAHKAWQFTKYASRQTRVISIATYYISKKVLLRTSILARLFWDRLLQLTELICIELGRLTWYGWILFKFIIARLSVLVSAILDLVKWLIEQTSIILVVSLKHLWVYLKHLTVFAKLLSLVALEQADRLFKFTGIYLTLYGYKFWQLLKLFASGLQIIAASGWHGFIRLCQWLLRFSISTLISLDRGFKATGYFLTLSLVRIFQYTFVFLGLCLAGLNKAIEYIVYLLVHGLHALIIYTWICVKFIALSPVILLNAILPDTVINHLKQYALLIRLDKPIGILLLLWPTLISLWIAANGWPDLKVLGVFVAGVFLMRSAGCAINDYADRDIDLKVKRTKDRPLTSGKITTKEALFIFVALSAIAFILVLQMNNLTITMSFIGLLLAITYPFMKRHHYLPQIHLGAAFGWAVPMAFAAQVNELAPVAWLLFFATVLWATAYDTMYAMVDREDDLLIGVKSTAILFEDADTLIIGIIQAMLILCLIVIGVKLELGGLYYLGVLIASLFAAWQQFLIKDRTPSKCFDAFLNNNWFGFVLFAGVFLEYQIGNIKL